jgi:hypothetical protein
MNKLLNDFARACAFGEDMLNRMAATKAIYEYLDAALASTSAPGMASVDAAEDARDAARYRWIARADHFTVDRMLDDAENKRDLDAAIDAARQEPK